MKLPGLATRNIRLKAVAAVLATVTWATVVYASNPPDSRSVTIRVPQDSGAVSPYVLVHPIADQVIRVIGTREHLNAFVAADLSVTVNYRVINHPGLQTLPMSVVNNDRDVVLDTPPTSVTAEVDHLASAPVQVTVDVTHPPPEGYVVSSQSTNPSSVTVIGPQRELAGVRAVVSVDLSNWRTNYQADKSVVLTDATGQPLGDFGITIQTIAGHQDKTVQVAIAVAASLTSRASAVVPRVSGTVAPGHAVAAISISSLTVILQGPQDLLNTLDSVQTETIQLGGLSSSHTFTVHILTPAGVTANPDTVTVIVTVTAVAQATAAPTPVAPSPTPTPTASPTPSPTP